jgi:hypothetical protein
MVRGARRLLAREEAEQARIERERQEEARVRREQQAREKAERERADRERAERCGSGSCCFSPASGLLRLPAGSAACSETMQQTYTCKRSRPLMPTHTQMHPHALGCCPGCLLRRAKAERAERKAAVEAAKAERRERERQARAEKERQRQVRGSSFSRGQGPGCGAGAP